MHFGELAERTELALRTIRHWLGERPPGAREFPR